MGLIFLSFVIMVWVERITMESSLTDSKARAPQSAVQIAIGIMENQYERYQKGEIDESTAKQLALNAIKSLRYQGQEYIWVNDYDHVMLMHPIKPDLNGKNLYDLKDPNDKYLFRHFVTTVKNDGEGFVDYLWPKPGFEQPVPKVSFVKGFAPWQWIAGSGLYIDDVAGEVNSATIELVVSLSILFILVFASLFFITQSILKPLRAATRRMNDISRGEGDLTQNLEEDGHDEITLLAKDFNRFVNKLRNVLRETGASVSQLSASVSTLTNVADTSAQCSNRQQQETDQTASAVNQLSASAIQIAQSAEQARNNSQNAKEETDTGRNVVAASVQMATELSDEIRQSQQTINDLKLETENIGSLLTVIQGIAEQTNLLALNAAIEAARAGEQGRGFAVVADEVRTLAGKTQSATEEIDEMIAKLQNGAGSAVAAMDQSVHKTGASLEHAKDAERSLSAIAQAIDVINDMNSQIAAASEQQSQVSEEINRSISSIVDLSAETRSTTTHVLESSEDIKTVGETLNRLVGQFKV